MSNSSLIVEVYRYSHSRVILEKTTIRKRVKGTFSGHLEIARVKNLDQPFQSNIW